MKNSALILYICLTNILCGQNKIEFKLVDDKQQAVSFCLVAMLKASDSSLVKGNVSSEQGDVLFENLPKGEYVIKINAMGLAPYYSARISVDSLSQLKLEPITLVTNSQNLQEVEIAVFKPTIEFKKGIIVLNTENDLIARGNTVLDLLKRLPGVIVDGQSNVMINGNSNVRFLIDGRMQLLPTSQIINILSGMSAETIKSLELIKNPPARYDAAGIGGMINIITKKAILKGFNGSATQSYSQGKRARYNTVIYLSSKSNKLSVFSNIDLAHRTFEDETEFNHVLNTTGTTNAFNTRGTSVDQRQVGNISLGMEYDFTKKTSFGVYFNNSLSKGNPVQLAKTKILEGEAFNYSTFVYRSDNQQNYNVPSFNVSLSHKLDSNGSQVQYQGDYLNSITDEKKRVDNYFFDSSGNEIAESSFYNTDIHNDYKISNHKVDLYKQFKKEFSLEAGAKGGFVDINSRNILMLHNKSAGFYNGDTTFSNNYNYNEQILAAYITLYKNFRKIGLSLGVRGEQTDVNAKNLSTFYKLKRSYLNLFPSGSMDIRFNQKNTITTSYSYRIDRPGYDMMNPVRIFNNQLDYSVGNSELRPQYSHNMSVDYNYNNLFFTSINYHRVSDFIFSYSYAMPDSQVNIDTIFNMPVNNSVVISEFVQKQIKWYNFQLYSHLQYSNFEGRINGEDVGSQNFQWYFSLNNEFRLPKNFKIVVNGYYASKFKNGMQTYYPGNGVSIVLNESFFKDKLNLTVGFFDIFWGERNWHTSKLPDQSYYYSQRLDTRRIRITIQWKFGKMKIEQKLNNRENNIRFDRVERNG